MWSSTRCDMTTGNWVPNHFVAVLPIGEKNQVDVEFQQWKPVKMKNVQKLLTEIEDDLLQNTGTNYLQTKEPEIQIKKEAEKVDEETCFKSSKQNNEFSLDEQKKKEVNSQKRDVNDTDVKSDEIKIELSNNGQCTEENHSAQSLDNEAHVNEEANFDKKITSYANEFEMLSPGDLLGRYVLVKYEEKPYPGIVVDVDESEVYVECMHRVGRSLKDCSFYWPKAVKDICWYEMENVLAVIPEPELKNRKYFVNPELWNFALQKCSMK